jgi:hypothetical protein
LPTSDDGKSFVVEVTYPLSDGGRFVGPSLRLFDARGELWILDEELRSPKRIGRIPGGAWAPSGFPKDKRLAALTLLASDGIGFAVWELKSTRLGTVTAVNVEAFLAKFRTAESAYGGPRGFFQVARQYVWLDEMSLLFC